MEEKSTITVRNNFHDINNLLNRITTQAGMTRYHLEENGFDLEKIEDERAKIIKIMDAMEGNALKIAEILRKLHEDILRGNLRNE